MKGAWTFLYISLEHPVNCFIINSFKSRHDSIVNLHVPITCFYNYNLWLILVHFRASLVGQTVKNLPAMQETWVRSLGREDPLEKEMATHSSIFAWRIISRTEEFGGLQSMES